MRGRCRASRKVRPSRFVQHLVVHLAIVWRIEVDVHRSVLVLVYVSQVGRVHQNLSAISQQFLQTVEQRWQTLEFADTLDIVRVDADSLILGRGDGRRAYSRAADAFDAEPENETHVVLEGTVTFAPEVRTFRAAGDSTTFWLIDESGCLEQRFVESGRAEWTVGAELELCPVDKSVAEFAADYDGAYRVVRILRLDEAE